jgi:hypothetical protein
MLKITGNLRVTTTPKTQQSGPVFEVVFEPYAGRIDSRPVVLHTYDELYSFLIALKLDEEDASRWSGRARSEGVLLIPSVEQTETQLKENGLIAS